jgi:hypothetical protein
MWLEDTTLQKSRPQNNQGGTVVYWSLLFSRCFDRSKCVQETLGEIAFVESEEEEEEEACSRFVAYNKISQYVCTVSAAKSMAHEATLRLKPEATLAPKTGERRRFANQ